jgi:hypothetical protein
MNLARISVCILFIMTSKALLQHASKDCGKLRFIDAPNNLSHQRQIIFGGVIRVSIICENLLLLICVICVKNIG